MTTIRRTLSPVPRPGTLLGGEACFSVASPLSKCSSCKQDYTTPTSGPMSSSWAVDYVFYRVHTFLLSLFSKRASRPLERPKAKGHVWRKSLFHFLVCFLVGVFVGFTPFASIETSRNRAFTFDQLGNVRLYEKASSQENEASNGTLVPEWVQDSETGFEKLLVIVTPTGPPARPCCLDRLARALKLVRPPLLWVVVETVSQSMETAQLLRRSGVMYRHLVYTQNTTGMKDARVHQRNAALSHIETHRLDGIVYFADDTNVYSTQLFQHMRRIRRFGAWPIAKLKAGTGHATIVGPVCNATRITGWHTHDVMRRLRRFHTELSGFAFNSTILWDPKRWGRPTVEPIRHLDTVNAGFQVSKFIEQIVEDETEMEGVPENCSKVLVWHARND